MSLTSYRAAPPRVKPLRAFAKMPETVGQGRRGSRGLLLPSQRLPWKATPGQAHRVRAVCTNPNRLWKGLRGGFFRLYDRSRVRIPAGLPCTCQKFHKSPACGNKINPAASLQATVSSSNRAEHVPHFSALLKETVAERFDATELLITGVEDEVAKGFAHRSITSSSPGRPGWSGWSRRPRGAISRLSRSSSAASRPRSSMCQISTRRPSASPRQVAQGWPDLHRAGLCAGAGARVPGLRRKGARADAAHVRHRSRQQGLHLDHFRPALRAAASGCRAPIRSPHR